MGVDEQKIQSEKKANQISLPVCVSLCFRMCSVDRDRRRETIEISNGSMICSFPYSVSRALRSRCDRCTTTRHIFYFYFVLRLLFSSLLLCIPVSSFSPCPPRPGPFVRLLLVSTSVRAITRCLISSIYLKSEHVCHDISAMMCSATVRVQIHSVCS